MTHLIRPATLLLALLALTGVLAGTASAGTPTTGTGIGCTSTRACTPTHGGAFIQTRKESCTAGLPVRDARGQWYLVTAGHCVANNIGATWTESGLALGQGTRWEYGGKGTEGVGGTSDIGLIKITANLKTWNARSRVLVVGSKARTQTITKARDAKLGEKVCVTTGRTGTTRCGTVVLASTSLSYASPGLSARLVKNLVLVKGVCVNPGDSGSPVYAGSSAVGITVAKSFSGCYLWYAKLPVQLTHFHLTVAG